MDANQVAELVAGVAEDDFLKIVIDHTASTMCASYLLGMIHSQVFQPDLMVLGILMAVQQSRRWESAKNRTIILEVGRKFDANWLINRTAHEIAALFVLKGLEKDKLADIFSGTVDTKEGQYLFIATATRQTIKGLPSIDVSIEWSDQPSPAIGIFVTEVITRQFARK